MHLTNLTSLLSSSDRRSYVGCVYIYISIFFYSNPLRISIRFVLVSVQRSIPLLTMLIYSLNSRVSLNNLTESISQDHFWTHNTTNLISQLNKNFSSSQGTLCYRTILCCSMFLLKLCDSFEVLKL